jgi:hypothetical protein
VAVIAALVACDKPENAFEKKTQVTTTSPQGKVQTTKETRQVGNTVVSSTKTKSETEAGTIRSNVETFIGTVTIYEADKKIEILTGQNSRHTFDLDTESLMVRFVEPVQVGSHVRLVAKKGGNGAWSSVSVEPAP